jgi:cytochrome d ubiquinol oxidase subunit I
VIADGRAQLESFLDVLFNPNIFYQFPHVLFSGFVTASFFIMGISAYHLVRGKDPDIFKPSFQIAAVIALVSTTLIIFNGHDQAQHMVQIQPMKTASAEALWETEDPASLSILTIGDLSLRGEVFSIRIPGLLSLLSYNQLSGEVRGINELQAEYEERYGPGNYIPPVAIPYWSFRIMIGAGFLMVVVAIYAVFLSVSDLVESRSKILKAFPFLIILPYLANASGWLLTEVGRFPWVVYGLVTLEEGVSVVVPAGAVLFSLIGYILIYFLLIFATIYLLRKYAKAGPEAAAETPIVDTSDQAPTLVGAQD